MQQIIKSSYTNYIPATNRPATSIHGERPTKYIRHPTICGRLATRSTSFVLRERSDHLKNQFKLWRIMTSELTSLLNCSLLGMNK